MKFQINAKIDAKLFQALEQISQLEERPKTYYVRKGIENFIKERIEYLEDMEDISELKEIEKNIDINKNRTIL